MSFLSSYQCGPLFKVSKNSPKCTALYVPDNLGMSDINDVSFIPDDHACNCLVNRALLLVALPPAGLTFPPSLISPDSVPRSCIPQILQLNPDPTAANHFVAASYLHDLLW